MQLYSPFAVAASLGGLVTAALASPALSHDASQASLFSADAKRDLPNSLREQSDQVCDARSRQWTGWINVSGGEKALLLWVITVFGEPIRATGRPSHGLVEWVRNTGPLQCVSLETDVLQKRSWRSIHDGAILGDRTRFGKCLAVKGGNGTVRNEHSWNNFANVLFIDQPAGVGFSSMNGGTEGGPDNIAEASEDFDKFLSTFFANIFPQYSHLPFHITGESFGGVYVPFFVNHISKRQKLGVPGVFQTPIASIVLVDAVIDMASSSYIGMYDHMCKFGQDGKNKLKLGFNEITCRAVEKAVPRCASLGYQCVETYNLDLCREADAFCNEDIGVYLDVRVGGRVPYDDRVLRENGTLPMCGADLYADYMNQPHLQAALGLEDWNFTSVNMDLNMRWEASGGYLHTLYPTTEGNKRVYDELAWSHQASFWLEKYVDWAWPDKSGEKTQKGGEFKAADKLAFTTFDDAGHEAVGHQREPGAFLVKFWLSSTRDGPCAFLDRRTDTIWPSPAQNIEL
ncbi:hypothetical protein PG994_011853 [Apiospora phragmitis]|uniref:carboxypeptidase C n=1 Tax=Apiospora phragmitis TaxID=2905665 RepID=A0ABR1TU83_9PEZI